MKHALSNSRLLSTISILSAILAVVTGLSFVLKEITFLLGPQSDVLKQIPLYALQVHAFFRFTSGMAFIPDFVLAFIYGYLSYWAWTHRSNVDVVHRHSKKLWLLLTSLFMIIVAIALSIAGCSYYNDPLCMLFGAGLAVPAFLLFYVSGLLLVVANVNKRQAVVKVE